MCVRACTFPGAGDTAYHRLAVRCARTTAALPEAKCKGLLLVQALLEALLDAVGAELAPTDSPALLAGLVDVQTAPQLDLLWKIPFHIPAHKVTLVHSPYKAS